MANPVSFNSLDLSIGNDAIGFQGCKSLKGVKCPLGHSPERLGSKLGKRVRLDAVLAL